MTLRFKSALNRYNKKGAYQPQSDTMTKQYNQTSSKWAHCGTESRFDDRLRSSLWLKFF
ncbi:hypothetical protein VCRLGP7_120044 [Vibrio crassostreae]|nr:hypothetical protein VCRLGP7_120044 [Vibrio crassostreae]